MLTVSTELHEARLGWMKSVVIHLWCTRWSTFVSGGSSLKDFRYRFVSGGSSPEDFRYRFVSGGSSQKDFRYGFVFGGSSLKDFRYGFVSGRSSQKDFRYGFVFGRSSLKDFWYWCTGFVSGGSTPLFFSWLIVDLLTSTLSAPSN